MDYIEAEAHWGVCLPPHTTKQLRDADNLAPVADVARQPTLLAVAAKFPAKDAGAVRLIDNCILGDASGL